MRQAIEGKVTSEVSKLKKQLSKPKNKSQKRTGRPSVIKEKNREEANSLMKVKMEYRPIEIWNHKLENMYTILTAEDGLSKLLSLRMNLPIITPLLLFIFRIGNRCG